MFNFSRYYDTGDYLVRLNDESNIRSGISRYYYSGLGSVREYLVEIINEVSFANNYKIHKRICDRLIYSDDITDSSIGEKLIELKEIRNDADYDWNLDLDYFCEHLTDVQKKSKEILEQVNALRNSPPFKI